MGPALRVLLPLVLGLVALLGSRSAGAAVLEAPAGGQPVALDGVVACAAVGGWSIEPGGVAVRPPANAAPGTAVDLTVAKTLADCATSTTTVRLLTLGDLPTIDPGSIVLALDDGRVEARGRGLRGVTVTSPSAKGTDADTCRDPRLDGATEVCTWAVAKTASADPSAGALRWLPPGAVAAPDAVVFGADGKPIPPATFVLQPARVDLAQLVPNDASVDVSSGVGVLRLAHPEAVAGVDCGPLRCDVANGTLTIAAPAATVTTVDVKVRLIAHVAYVRKAPADPVPIVRVALVRCPMRVASGPVPRGVEQPRAVVAVEGACAADIDALRFVTGGRRLDVVATTHQGDAAFVVLSLDHVEGDELSISAVRPATTAAKTTVDGAVVAVARAETRAVPPVRSMLELPGYPAIGFIPNNRGATVHVPRLEGAELVLLPVDGVYAVREEGGATVVQGDVAAAGDVTFRFGYRVASLPPPLDKLDLGVLGDTLQRSVKEANLPAAFAAGADSDKPLAEVTCLDASGRTARVRPGVAAHVPFAERDGCRLILHRERLDPALGTQKLQLEIDVVRVDGTPRPEAHVSQTIVLRAGAEPRVAWIHGIGSAYERATVRLTHVADEAHYLGALEIATGAPMLQWSIVFGTGRARLYATTAIPTGLYRFGNAHSSGPLSLNFGVLSRLTWVDPEGHEGLLGLEAGMLAFGLTGDTTASGNTLTQVGAVVGAGLAIPIANAGQATQASINLHLWYEQRLTEGGGDGRESPRAVIFGPSISVGNVGTTF